MTNRIILLLVADLHSGHQLALLSPKTKLKKENPSSGKFEDYTPSLTPVQNIIWGDFQSDLNAVASLAAGDPIHVYVVGDITEGNRFVSRLVSPVPYDQMIMAYYNLVEFTELPNIKSIWLDAGTDVHLFDGTSEIAMANLLKANNPNIEVDYSHHTETTILDYKIDTAHHGPPPGSREWLRGNVARYYTQSIIQSCIAQGTDPPDIVVRAHYHQPIIERVENMGHVTWLANLPSYKFVDDWTRKAGRSPMFVTIGMFAVELITENGYFGKHQPRFYKFTHTYDLRTKRGVDVG